MRVASENGYNDWSTCNKLTVLARVPVNTVTHTKSSFQRAQNLSLFYYRQANAQSAPIVSLCDASDETPEGRNGEHWHVTGLDFLKFGTVGFCHIKQQGSERAALLTEEHTQHLECVHEETQHYCCYRCQSCDGVIASQATIVAKYTRSYTCD